MIVVGLILLVIAGWTVIKKPKSSIPEEGVSDTLVQEVPMNEAVEGEKGMTMQEQQQLREKIDQSLQDKQTQSSVLKDVRGGQAFGTAYRLLSTGSFYHKAVLSSLPALEKGFFLEGWLVNPSGAYFSTGRVIPEGEKGVLYYFAQEDKSAYNTVVITLEPEDGNPAPAKHILEGQF